MAATAKNAELMRASSPPAARAGWKSGRKRTFRSLPETDSVIDAGENRDEEQGGRIWKVQRNRLFFHGKASHIDWNRVMPGQKLWKTDDPALNAELKKMREHMPEAETPIHLVCTGAAGEPLTVFCPEYGCSVQSSQPLQRAENRPLTSETLERQLGRLGGTGFRLFSCENRLEDGVMIPLSTLNQTRRALGGAAPGRAGSFRRNPPGSRTLQHPRHGPRNRMSGKHGGNFPCCAAEWSRFPPR